MVFNMLTGGYAPTVGTVLLDGVPLNGKKHISLWLQVLQELFKIFVYLVR